MRLAAVVASPSDALCGRSARLLPGDLTGPRSAASGNDRLVVEGTLSPGRAVGRLRSCLGRGKRAARRARLRPRLGSERDRAGMRRMWVVSQVGGGCDRPERGGSCSHEKLDVPTSAQGGTWGILARPFFPQRELISSGSAGGRQPASPPPCWSFCFASRRSCRPRPRDVARAPCRETGGWSWSSIARLPCPGARKKKDRRGNASASAWCAQRRLPFPESPTPWEAGARFLAALSRVLEIDDEVHLVELPRPGRGRVEQAPGVLEGEPTRITRRAPPLCEALHPPRLRWS